ncbi:MAG: T9SS type A sorting domain-containing protein [Paludibacter sp.]|nr:T9SS type A sorting domain-containing protein [Paludibacter sp.]
MKKILHIIASLFICVSIFAQTPPPTVMTNLGLMKVAVVNATDTATMYVGGTFKAQDVSAIDLDGKMIITGNFVQDAMRPAFVSSEYDADNAGIPDKVSDGTFIFRGDFAAGSRAHKITTDNDAVEHDRGNQFLAFPNIILETNDTVELTSYMGIDAKTIKSTNNGRLLLRSENIDGKVYDASLRFPYSVAQATAGIIAIERNVELYRTNQVNKMYAFSSPFINQRSGYFAGNWVRNPIIDANGYVLYPLADAMDNTGHIYPEYYVIDPFEQLLPGQPYLIKYVTSDYEYSDDDLLITGGSSTTLQKTLGTYLFNGYPYNLSELQGYIPEQILTNEPLYSHNLTAQTTPKNVIVGNSYSAPISVEKLINYLNNRIGAGMNFAPFLYFFPAGSQSYQQVNWTTYDVNAFPIQYIPSQSIFMVKHYGGGGNLTFDKSLTVHAKVTNNLVAEGSIYYAPAASGVNGYNSIQNNLLKFKVSPADNANIFDQTAVFVRSDASAGNDRYDMAKVANFDEGSFILSMRDDANARQYQMGVPINTTSAQMSFRPAKNAGSYILTASNVENMNTEVVVLEDTKTNYFQDLRANPIYEFNTEQYDYENRFIVHFTSPIPTGNNDLQDGEINAYYNNNRAIIIQRLNEKDVNSIVELIDVQGRVISKDKISSYPTQSIDANLTSGVYFVRVKGARNYTGKVVVK